MAGSGWWVVFALEALQGFSFSLCAGLRMPTSNRSRIHGWGRGGLVSALDWSGPDTFTRRGTPPAQGATEEDSGTDCTDSSARWRATLCIGVRFRAVTASFVQEGGVSGCALLRPEGSQSWVGRSRAIMAWNASPYCNRYKEVPDGNPTLW